jgi:hypothetical protein
MLLSRLGTRLEASDMDDGRSMALLVGDNPFHNISHLSQARSRDRGNAIGDAGFAAGLVTSSMENGADGFMFSVSETTLSILKTIRDMDRSENMRLYAIVPYAYEYVRLATQVGGVSGLARRMAKQVLFSMNFRAMATGVKGAVRTDPVALLKTYLFYEISRIESSAPKQANLDSVMLHEIITEMALALNLDWLLKAYVDFMLKLGIKPGFETRNFAFLVRKFREWNMDFGKVVIATPFNKVGFQMNPSREECEKALEEAAGSEVIAMSVLAAGYLKPREAMDYIQGLRGLKGVVVGVSRESQARETFKLLEGSLKS